MEFKEFVKIGIVLSMVIIVGVVILALSKFALDLSNAVIFTNILLLLIVIVQLLEVSVLIYIYEILKGKGGRRK